MNVRALSGKKWRIQINEIWDKGADSFITDDPVVFPRNEINGNYSALVTLADYLSYIQVRRIIRNAGIENVYTNGFITSAVRYKLYNTYLPFMIDNYV